MTARTLPGLGLEGGYDVGENGWGPGMAANLLLLSVLTQGGVLDYVAATPGAPVDGNVYIFDGTHPTQANKVAVYDNGGWVYYTPLEGWKLYDRTGNHFLLFDGSTWSVFATAPTLDTDGTLGANSDSVIASQKAVKTYVDTVVTGLWDWKGATDCSGNPNYPAASKGDAYTVSGSGKIGGASGSTVDVGDVFIATADNAGGTQAAVGASWVILEHNLVSALSGAVADATDVLTGTDNTKLATPDAIAALWEQGANIASAGTIAIGEGGYFHVTGVTTITDIDPTTDKAGRAFVLVFDGILTLTHNASTLILPTGANIVTAAGDVAVFRSEGSDAVRCVSYQRASGAPLTGGGGGGTVIPGGGWTQLTVSGTKNTYGAALYGAGGALTLAAGQIIEVEAILHKTTTASAKICVGDGTERFEMVDQDDGNAVFYKFEGGASSMGAAGTDTNSDYAGPTHIKMSLIVISTTDVKGHGFVNGRRVPSQATGGLGVTSGINIVGSGIQVAVDTTTPASAQVWYRIIG